MAETLTWGISSVEKEKKGEEEEGGGGSVEEVAGEGRKGEGEEVNLEREKQFSLTLQKNKGKCYTVPCRQKSWRWRRLDWRRDCRMRGRRRAG